MVVVVMQLPAASAFPLADRLSTIECLSLASQSQYRKRIQSSFVRWVALPVLRVTRVSHKRRNPLNWIPKAGGSQRRLFQKSDL